MELALIISLQNCRLQLWPGKVHLALFFWKLNSQKKSELLPPRRKTSFRQAAGGCGSASDPKASPDWTAVRKGGRKASWVSSTTATVRDCTGARNGHTRRGTRPGPPPELGAGPKRRRSNGRPESSPVDTLPERNSSAACRRRWPDLRPFSAREVSPETFPARWRPFPVNCAGSDLQPNHFQFCFVFSSF